MPPAEKSRVEVAAYYFPGYHADPRIDARKGKGWTEWDLIRAAKPRFPGHNQPRVPAWGYQDESDSREMSKKIAAAADHGLTAFIFDWYWYEDKPYLNRALDQGFLKAANRKRLKFALMWANHDWHDIMPAHEGQEPPLIYKGATDATAFGHVAEQAIRYFKQPNYWRVGGKPYFSIYEVMTLVQGLGGIEKARGALDAFRAKAKNAGLPGVHLNAVGWGPLTPEAVTQLGFDSVTDYVWAHHLAPEPYPEWARKSEEMWPEFSGPNFPPTSRGLRSAPTISNLKSQISNPESAIANPQSEIRNQLSPTLNPQPPTPNPESGIVNRKSKIVNPGWPVPYFPNVSVGWDNTPRFSWLTNVTGSTPAQFEDALKKAKAFLESRKGGPKVLTVNSWNEWTEGSYLEPDMTHGMGHLEALGRVFGHRKDR